MGHHSAKVAFALPVQPSWVETLVVTKVTREKGWTFPNVYKSQPLPTEL